MMAPVVFLVSGLYTYPLKALRGLFELIPLGRMLPADGGADVAVASVLKVFELSLQLASPFILFAILWYFIMGHLSRMAGRMQIYFVSVPGQILLGLLLMAALIGTLLTSWEHTASVILEAIPEVR
jgi:flagellar biosynthetic protein FliR